MIYSIKMEELDYWVAHIAKLGDIAFSKTHHDEREYMYAYKGPDPNPAWLMFNVNEDIVNKYLEEINKLKIEDTIVDKRCENCQYFNSMFVKGVTTGTIGSWCEHEKHKGMYVPKFTSCPEYAPKEALTTPFDGVKFYLIDNKTGELDIKYVCEDCGKVMDKPYHWWLTLPVKGNCAQTFGYHFRCKECEGKKREKELT